MPEAFVLGLMIATASALAMMGAMMVLAGLAQRSVPPLFAPDTEDQDAVFIFRAGKLIDHSDMAERLLDTLLAKQDLPQSPLPGGMRRAREKLALPALMAFLAPHFDDLQAQLEQLPQLGDLTLKARDDTGLVIAASARQGLVQLRLTDTRAEGALIAMDKFSYDALHDELDALRDVARTAPVLIWKSDEQGRIVWANSGYVKALCDAFPNGAAMTWPLPSLFGPEPFEERLSMELNDKLRWFSYSTVSMGKLRIHFATPIDSAVQSEFARREMLHMLTRTFATLPVGLALFDAGRRLQVFNPALVDLTGLDPFFLAARPDLAQLLHSLREIRMVPEPKDFNTWRDEMARLEKAASTGGYSEEWHLDDGRIYHVIGTPQPDGALAFFLQDITSEASLMRGYRAEIEALQTILDSVPDAVVAFNAAGHAVHANAGYLQLWGYDPCEDVTDSGLLRAVETWSRLCRADSFWADLPDFASSEQGATDILTGSGTLAQGNAVAIRAQKLPGGLLVVTFREIVHDIATLQRKAVALARRIASDDYASPRPAASPLGKLSDDAAPDSFDHRAARSEVKGRSVRHRGSRLRI